jgi:hypothetical protein
LSRRELINFGRACAAMPGKTVVVSNVAVMRVVPAPAVNRAQTVGVLAAQNAVVGSNLF